MAGVVLWLFVVLIGLTGGMGCGKSTVGKLFGKKGFRVVDADAVVHELLAEDAETIEAVSSLLGDEVRSESGGIDRKLVGERVFADRGLLEQLEAILHPRVRARWESEAAKGGNCLIEIPLLFEKNLQNNVDLTVCVFCHPDTQVERLGARGLDRNQATARIERQMPLHQKAELADYVLLNDGSLKSLEDQVDRLLLEIETH